MVWHISNKSWKKRKNTKSGFKLIPKRITNALLDCLSFEDLLLLRTPNNPTKQNLQFTIKITNKAKEIFKKKNKKKKEKPCKSRISHTLIVLTLLDPA